MALSVGSCSDYKRDFPHFESHLFSLSAYCYAVHADFSNSLLAHLSQRYLDLYLIILELITYKSYFFAKFHAMSLGEIRPVIMITTAPDD